MRLFDRASYCWCYHRSDSLIMADEVDDASEREEFHRQAAIALTIRQRLATGDGVCRICGDAVESDRLAVLPNTPHCSECATAVENDRAKASRLGLYR